MFEELKCEDAMGGGKYYSLASDQRIDLEKAFDKMILDLGWSGILTSPNKVIPIIRPISLGNYDYFIYDGVGETISEKEIKRMENVIKKANPRYRIAGRFYADANGDETRIRNIDFYTKNNKIMSISRLYRSWDLVWLAATGNMVTGMIPYVRTILRMNAPTF